MSEANHTPGPWVASFTRLSEVRATNGAVIAKCQKLTDLTNLQANARLIAAAPELLDACMAMLEWDDREKDHAIDFNARMDLCRAAFDKARAAIAKATGQPND